MPRGVPRIPQPREWVLTKMCSRCSEVKPWALYAPVAYWEDGSVQNISSRCRACRVDASREWRAGWERRNREQRTAYKAKWRQKNAAQNTGTNGRAGGLLPIEPLRRFLAEQQLDRDIETMAETTGVDERVIRRLMNEATCVGLVQADRLITRLGGVLEMVYPYEEEVA